jgi:hypothetical protein
MERLLQGCMYNLLEERDILATEIIASTFETSAHIGACSTVLIKRRMFVLIIKLITTNRAAQYYLGLFKNRIEGCGLDSSD